MPFLFKSWIDKLVSNTQADRNAKSKKTCLKALQKGAFSPSVLSWLFVLWISTAGLLTDNVVQTLSMEKHTCAQMWYVCQVDIETSDSITLIRFDNI